MRRLTLLLLLSLLAFTALAADVTGTWNAQIPGREGNMLDTTFKLKADGAKITGTMENQFGEREISDGKITGDDVSFVVRLEIGGDPIVFTYTGKVAGNEIKFTRERKSGDLGPVKVEFTAKRK